MAKRCREVEHQTEPYYRPGLLQLMSRYRHLWRFFKRRSCNRGFAGAVFWTAGALAVVILSIAMAARLAWPQAANAQESPNLPKPSEVVKIDTLSLGGALKPGATSQLEV